jgi:hypothetical protein
VTKGVSNERELNECVWKGKLTDRLCGRAYLPFKKRQAIARGSGSKLIDRRLNAFSVSWLVETHCEGVEINVAPQLTFLTAAHLQSLTPPSRAPEGPSLDADKGKLEG